MSANTSPIFTRQGDLQWNSSPIITANTTTDLTSGTIYLIHTADSTEGGYVQKVRLLPLGTNVATVARLWINNNGDTGTATNNSLLEEITMPTTTVSQVAKLTEQEMAIAMALPPSYRLYITLGTTVAAGFHAVAVAGKY